MYRTTKSGIQQHACNVIVVLMTVYRAKMEEKNLTMKMNRAEKNPNLISLVITTPGTGLTLPYL